MEYTNQYKDLREGLNLELLGKDIFRSTGQLYVPLGARGVFGGVLIAQALYAAILTTEDKYLPHSLSSYFLVSTRPDVPITYKVERLRDGNSFQSREIRAYQNSQLVFIENVSFVLKNITRKDVPLQPEFSKKQPVLQYHDYSTPRLALERGLKAPEANGIILLSNENMKEIYLKTFENGPTEYKLPIDHFVVPNDHNPDHKDYNKSPSEITTDLLVKVRTEITDERFHYVAFAYLSDAHFLILAMKTHKRPVHSASFSVSLDHQIHFHKPFNSNKWLQFHVEHPRATSSRMIVHGELFDGGELLATVYQEGFVVINDKKVAQRVKDQIAKL